jgi:ferredoxin
VKKLVVDLETCGRTGMCQFRYADLFDEDPSGFPVLKVDNVDHLNADEILQIIQCCPTGSIKLEDSEAAAG